MPEKLSNREIKLLLSPLNSYNYSIGFKNEVFRGGNHENSLQIRHENFCFLDGYFSLHGPIELGACAEPGAMQGLCLRRQGLDLPRDRWQCLGLLDEQPVRKPQGRTVGMPPRACRSP